MDKNQSTVEERRRRNRMSAQLSRERQRRYIEDLESTVEHLHKVNMEQEKVIYEQSQLIFIMRNMTKDTGPIVFPLPKKEPVNVVDLLWEEGLDINQ